MMITLALQGTVAFVHKTCLEKWLSESNSTACELCHHVYETERVPKYTAKQSIWKWFRHQPTNFGARVRAIRCDLIVCAVLTPFAIVITYICLFSADYYNQQRFSNIPTARWTSISLLIMIAIMLFGYYIWVYVVVGYHGRMWYYWWQRECIVRYIPPVPDQPNYPPNPPPPSQQQQSSSPQHQHLEEIVEDNGDSVIDLSISRSHSSTKNAASDETVL